MESSPSRYLSHLCRELQRCSSLPDAVSRINELAEQVLALAVIELERVRPELNALYAKRGRKPRDPVCMLRCLLLMSLNGITSINKWVKDLKKKPELVVLCGFAFGATAPGVGTIYDFASRLADGPWAPPCTHRPPRPSARWRGSRGRFRRSLRKEKREAKANADPATQDAPVRSAVSEYAKKLHEASAPDLSSLLALILMRCGVKSSFEAGLLPTALTVAGDGSLVRTQAASRGKGRCQCNKPKTKRPKGKRAQHEESEELCCCEKIYADPHATWGYNPHEERYVFGYRDYSLVARIQKDKCELPLFSNWGPAHPHDSLVCVSALVGFVKCLRQEIPQLHMAHFLGDCGHDAGALYELVRKLGAAPIIALHPRSKTLQDSQGRERDENGTPLCPGGAPMRLHGFDKNRGQFVFNCPAKRPGREKGKQVFRHRLERCPKGCLCEPQTVMGPLLKVALGDDPRLDLPIPRRSEKFNDLYKMRSSVERGFSVK
jgi:hypothetical protein